MRVADKRLINRYSVGVPLPDVWLRADDLALANNDPVDSWTSVGRITDSFSNTTTARPTFITGAQNGLPAVRFDGTSDHLDGSTAMELRTVTIYVALSATDVTGPDVVVGNLFVAGGFNLRFNAERVGTLAEGSTAVATSSTNLADSTPYVIEYFLRSDLGYGFTVNDASHGTGTATAANFANIALCIGARDSSSEFFAGDLFEVMIYDGVLDETTRKLIRSYLSAKWGI